MTNNDRFKKEWDRVSKIVRAYNRKNSTGYTMRYAFGAPTTSKLSTMGSIHSQEDFYNYLLETGISPPTAPRIEAIKFNNLLSRFDTLPTELNENILRYILRLHEIVSNTVLSDAIKSIIFVPYDEQTTMSMIEKMKVSSKLIDAIEEPVVEVDVSNKYNRGDTGKKYIDAIHQISENLQKEVPDKAEEIQQAEQEALSKAEQLIDEENFPIV